MADQQSREGWLPEGWKKEVKVNKDGTRDEFYVSLSGKVEFQSKLELLQYLKDSEHVLDKEAGRKENKTESACSKRKVVFEKDVPDGLPLGWTKEVKITRKGSKIRRDSFYTDPVTGYIFRSMKDALRYIATGDLGRLACRPKDIEEMHVKFEEDDTCAPAASKKPKEASNLIMDESRLKSCGSEKDDLTQNSTSPRGSIAVHDHISDQCGPGVEISSSDLPVTEGVNPNGESDSSKSERSEVPAMLASEGTTTVDISVNQSNGDKDSIKSGSLVLSAGSGPRFSISDSPTNNTKGHLSPNIVSSSNEFSVTPGVVVALGERPMQNGVGMVECKSPAPGRSKKKKDLSTPRRASKRLAGVQVDPVLQLETRSRKRQSVAFDPVLEHGMAHTAAEDTSSHQTDTLQEATGASGEKHPEMPADMQSNGDVSAPTQVAEKSEVARQRCDNKEFAAAPPTAVQFSTGEVPNMVGSGICIDQNLELSLDVPLEELWQDPCIAFAIQTLTESSFDNSNGINVSCGDLKYSGTSDSVVQEHHSEVADILSKDNDEVASPSRIPPADAWSDPCIAFAIKTLTDAIPLDHSLIIQDFIPQQSTSLHSQSSCSLNLPNSGEFCQNKFLCQPFGASGQPIFNQPGNVEPAMPLPGTTSLCYPSRASHPRSDGRSKKRIR